MLLAVESTRPRAIRNFEAFFGSVVHREEGFNNGIATAAAGLCNYLLENLEILLIFL